VLAQCGVQERPDSHVGERRLRSVSPAEFVRLHPDSEDLLPAFLVKLSAVCDADWFDAAAGGDDIPVGYFGQLLRGTKEWNQPWSEACAVGQTFVIKHIRDSGSFYDEPGELVASVPRQKYL
jgi:hypothetical protein